MASNERSASKLRTARFCLLGSSCRRVQFVAATVCCGGAQTTIRTNSRFRQSLVVVYGHMRVIDWARACCPNRNIKNKIPAEPVSGPRANSCDDDSMPVICPTGQAQKTRPRLRERDLFKSLNRRHLGARHRSAHRRWTGWRRGGSRRRSRHTARSRRLGRRGCLRCALRACARR